MSAALVHRPAPRAGVIASMVLLLVIVAPIAVVAPEKLAEPAALFGLGVTVAFEVVLLSIVLRKVDVYVEPAEVRLVGSRWPFGTREERVARARIRAVDVEYRPRGRSVRLVLRLDDASSVPLTRSFFGRSSRTDADLEALRSLLGLAPATGGPT